MRKQFDIKYRPQIESGEYKVVTWDGHPARIICWNSPIDKDRPIIGIVYDNQIEQYKADGRYDYEYETSNYDLFIVTPEEELTEFEDGLRKVCEEAVKEAAVFPDRTSEDFAKTHSAELLELAKEELKKTFYLLYKDDYRSAFDLGKAEALRTRATELTENLDKSGLDKDSIPYHLIEFMCNLYDCQNWKEIEGTAELYITRIKAAAMKDLPRWKKAVGYCFVGKSIMYDELGFYNSSATKPGCRYITYESLRILPGFNE